MPFGKLNSKQDSSVLGNASGFGDILLSATVWLVNTPETRTFFGITPFLSLPTGRYDKNISLNMGENRWKMILQGGLNTSLTNKVYFDLIGDVTTYGDNSEFGAANATLKQDQSYQAQMHLRYKFSPAFEISTGLSYVWGGEIEVNGAKKGNALSTGKYILGAAYSFKSTTQLAGTYSRDIFIENGIKESNRLLLRLTQVF